MIPDFPPPPPRPAHVTTWKHIEEARAELDRVLDTARAVRKLRRAAPGTKRLIQDSSERIGDMLAEHEADAEVRSGAFRTIPRVAEPGPGGLAAVP